MKVLKKSEPQGSSSFADALRKASSLAPLFPNRPEDELVQLPFVLGDTSNDDLMELYSLHVSWANYASFELARAEVEEDDAEADLKVVEAKYLISNSEAGKPGVQRVRAERETDPDVQRLAKLVRQNKAYRKLVSVLLGNTERSANLLSRELSRRIGLAPVLGRKNTGA